MVFTSSCIYREQSYPLSAFSLLSLASPLANGSGAETSHCESRKPNVRGVRVTAPAQEQGACPNQSWFLAQWQSFTCLLFSLISRLPSAVLHFPPSRRIAIRRFQVRFCAPGRGQPSYTSSGWGGGGGVGVRAAPASQGPTPLPPPRQRLVCCSSHPRCPQGASCRCWREGRSQHYAHKPGTIPNTLCDPQKEQGLGLPEGHLPAVRSPLPPGLTARAWISSFVTK